MKRFATTLIILLCLVFTSIIFAPTAKSVRADEPVYAYAAPKDLVANEFASASTLAVRDRATGDILFYVPESYYVMLTPTRWGYYDADYMGIEDCIVSEEDVTAESVKSYTGVTAENFGPNVLLITKEVVTLGTAAVNTSDGWTVKLLGYNGENLYIKAVKDDVTRFGAAPKTSFNDFSVSYHPVAQAERAGLLNQTPSDSVSGNESGSGTSSTLRIILIIGIIIPALIIVLLLFKPNRETSGYDKRAMKRQPDSRKVDYDRDRRYSDDYRRDYRDYPGPDRDYYDRDRNRNYQSSDRDYNDRRDERDYRNHDDRDDRDYRDYPKERD